MLPIVLDRDSGGPLAVQIAGAVRALVTQGVLRAGEPVPSTRTLAAQLGVSRSTAVQAYDQLISECYLTALPGGKTRVHPDANLVPPPNQPAHSSHGAPSDPTEDGKSAEVAPVTLDPGAPTMDLRPRNSLRTPLADSLWRESWRKAAGAASSEVPARGLLAAREAIAEHLRLMRSINVAVEDIFLTGGAREGLRLVLASLNLPVVAVESPGYPGLRGVIRRSSSKVREAPVSETGLIPGSLPEGVSGVLVTPNHLYPSGGTMPAPQRIELLSVAAKRDLTVLEDDLDSEFRHSGPVPPTLWELAPQTVVHLGTFSRVLTNEVQLGYLIAPARFHNRLVEARRDLGPGTSVIAQRAVTHYLEAGGLRRLITRRRRDLSRRRKMVTETLGAYGVQLGNSATAVVRCAHADQVLADCSSSGITTGSLSSYWRGEEEGILFSYDAAALAELECALETIGACLGKVVPRRA